MKIRIKNNKVLFVLPKKVYGKLILFLLLGLFSFCLLVITVFFFNHIDASFETFLQKRNLDSDTEISIIYDEKKERIEQIVLPNNKTIWDWLGLAFIPLIATGLGLWINKQLEDREKKKTAKLEEQEQKKLAEEKARKREEKEARDREEKAKREEDLKNSRLQEYLNFISSIVLDYGKLGDKPWEISIENIVQAKTQAIIRELRDDSRRQGAIFQFLYGVGLLPIVSKHFLQGSVYNNQQDRYILTERRLKKKLRIDEWDLSKEQLKGLNLSYIDLIRAKLHWTSLYQAKLIKANLAHADLFQVQLRGANLSQANLSQAELQKANLVNSTLIGTYFNMANLSGANLSGANLSGANLLNADLSGADLSGANLSGANLSKTNFTKVKNITVSQIKKAKNWHLGKFDNEFKNSLNSLNE